MSQGLFGIGLGIGLSGDDDSGRKPSPAAPGNKLVLDGKTLILDGKNLTLGA